MSHLANFHGIQAVALHDIQQDQLIRYMRVTQVVILFGFITTLAIQTAFVTQRLDTAVHVLSDMNHTVSNGLFAIQVQLGGSLFRLDELYVAVEQILSEVAELDAISVNISGDDFNITMELGQLEATAKQILHDMNQGQAYLLDAIQTESNLTNEIFNGDDGWGSSVKDHLEDADDFLSAIADTLEIIHDIVGTVGTIIEGIQQMTLKGILDALQGGAFNEKVYLAVSEAEWAFEAGNLEMTALEATALETADVLLDACVSALGEGPIECVGGEFMEFAIEGLAAEGLVSSSVKLEPVVRRQQRLAKYANSCTLDPHYFPHYLYACPEPAHFLVLTPCP